MTTPDRRFPLNLRRVEIEVTSDCDVRCYECNRSCRQAASTESMDPAQLERFVAESIDVGWHWHTISLLGGEPTLHPELADILGILRTYKERFPCVVELVSNGFGERARRFIDSAPAWLQIRNSRKTGPIQQFAPYNIAPLDLDGYRSADFSRGCPIAAEFGLGLTRYGYYPCGPGASLDRVFGFDIGVKALGRVDEGTLREQLETLCGHCGHFLPEGDGDEAVRLAGAGPKKQSATWRRAYRSYRERVPRLSTY